MQERERRGGYKVAASLSPILVPNTKSFDFRGPTFVRREMVLRAHLAPYFILSSPPSTRLE
jgi:hypothetical protein